MANLEKKMSAVAKDIDYDLLLAEETLILDVQMTVQRVLNEKGMTQAELARRLGVGESYVSQMLSDSARNLTLRTVARVMTALGETPHLTIQRWVEQVAERAQPYQCDADFGPWGEIMILDTVTDQLRLGSAARDWAANENHVARPEWAEAA
jgi:transcriptional regulator with XRE-family HTH domain